MRERISPCKSRPTASGLIIANVRSRAKINSSKRKESHRQDAGVTSTLPQPLIPGPLAFLRSGCRRRGLPGIEADYGLLHVGLNEFGRNLFGIAADFADQDDRVRFRIIVEHL